MFNRVRFNQIMFNGRINERLMLDEKIFVNDSNFKTIFKTLQLEIITLIDNVSKNFSFVLIETIHLADSIYKVISKTITEILTLTDSIYKAKVFILSEIITLSDVVKKTISKTLIEILTLNELFYKKARGLWQKLTKHTSIWTRVETNPNIINDALLLENGEQLLTEDGEYIILGEQPEITYTKESRHSTIWNKLP